MLTERRLRYAWCAATSGLVLISVFPGSSWMCEIFGSSDQNRWIHFLSFGTVVAISFVVLRRRTGILTSLAIVATGIAVEFLQKFIPGSNIQGQNILADLFGAAGGILLGLNLRAMRRSAKADKTLGSRHSQSTLR